MVVTMTLNMTSAMTVAMTAMTVTPMQNFHH